MGLGQMGALGTMGPMPGELVSSLPTAAGQDCQEGRMRLWMRSQASQSVAARGPALLPALVSISSLGVSVILDLTSRTDSL